jgi:hypothetical protein
LILIEAQPVGPSVSAADCALATRACYRACYRATARDGAARSNPARAFTRNRRCASAAHPSVASHAAISRAARSF